MVVLDSMTGHKAWPSAAFMHLARTDQSNLLSAQITALVARSAPAKKMMETFEKGTSIVARNTRSQLRAGLSVKLLYCRYQDTGGLLGGAHRAKDGRCPYCIVSIV